MSSMSGGCLLKKILQAIRHHIHLPYLHCRHDASVQSLPETTHSGGTTLYREDKHATIVYHIQTFNVTVTADTVQQLNVNPKEVINTIHDQVESEINKLQPPSDEPQTEVEIEVSQ